MPFDIPPTQITEWARAHSATVRKVLISIVLGVFFTAILHLFENTLVESFLAGSIVDIVLKIGEFYFYTYIAILIVVPYFLFLKFGLLRYSLIFSYSAFYAFRNIQICDPYYGYLSHGCGDRVLVLEKTSDVVIFIGPPDSHNSGIVLLVVFMLFGVSGYGLQQLKRRATRWWAEARN
jgi:hypothetical protein